MASTRTPPRDWVDQGLKALAEGGPDAVRIEPLAQALGVTKGGFYWHFKDRNALLSEMLDRWERQSVTEIITVVEDGGGDSRVKLRRLFTIARTRPDLLRVDLAVRDWARRDRRVAERLRRVDNRRIEYMRGLFAEFCPDEEDVEARSLLVGSLWIGSHFFAADHDGRHRGDVLDLALSRLLA